MKIEEMTIDEIEKRDAELVAAVETATDPKEVAAMTEERKQLQERVSGIKAELEERKKEARSIATGSVVTSKVEDRTKMDKADVIGIGSAEYRNAWLREIRNLDVTEVEKRALTTNVASAGYAVPTQTMNKIIELVYQYAPMLTKIELFMVPDKISVPKEGTIADAALHTEGATITSDADTLGVVTLANFEIEKLVTVSKSVMKMSVDAFETWLTMKIAKKVAEKISEYIINGTGSSQPAGVNSITWVDDTNQITVALASNLAATDITGVVALLGGGYYANAEWYMSHETFFSDFHPLMALDTNNLVTESGGVYRVMGKVVNFDERVTVHEAFLGDAYEGVVGNLVEEVTVVSEFVVRENSYDFLGTAIFDCAIKNELAFVKIAKATE